jgi:hypothetical protein
VFGCDFHERTLFLTCYRSYRLAKPPPPSLLAQQPPGISTEIEEQNIISPQGIFRMIRDSDFADNRTFQKAIRITFERDCVWKRALVLIG